MVGDENDLRTRTFESLVVTVVVASRVPEQQNVVADVYNMCSRAWGRRRGFVVLCLPLALSATKDGGGGRRSFF